MRREVIIPPPRREAPISIMVGGVPVIECLAVALGLVCVVWLVIVIVVAVDCALHRLAHEAARSPEVHRAVVGYIELMRAKFASLR